MKIFLSETCVFPLLFFWGWMKELQFECIPRSLMEQVLNFLNVRHDCFLLLFFLLIHFYFLLISCLFLFLLFYLILESYFHFLQDVREDLRCSMAKDVLTIKNESLIIGEDPDCTEILCNPGKEELLSYQHKDSSLDFQKKFTLSKHEKQDAISSSLLGSRETYKQLSGTYKI